jgi:hypothetical protein
MRQSAFLCAGLVAALGCAGAANAANGPTYTVTGTDSFSIGDNDITSEVDYAGTQTLAVRHTGRITRYAAHVDYTRSDGTASTGATCDYVADVLPTGETLATADHDPDYLTVLNQPFAAELDPATLADLRFLRGSVPFDFPSPFTGSSLHGYLQHVPSGPIGPRRSVGVTFEAAGPMHGSLPDRPGLVLRGTIAMRGTAYYDIKTAVLLSLETTVTISGNVSNRAGNDPVTITFRRTIRTRDLAAHAPRPSPSPSP